MVKPGEPVLIPHDVNTEVFAPAPSDVFGTGDQKLIDCFGLVREMKGTYHFVEALFCAVPVVATDVGAFRDFFSQDCGEIVPKDDSGALTTSIKTMLARDLPVMGQAGRTRVQAEFGLEREANALVDLYRKLLTTD